MAEKRKPDTVLWVRHTGGKSMKVELFHAAQFERHLHHFTVSAGCPFGDKDPTDQHRLRVDGVWYPAGKRHLYTQQQIADLLCKEIFRHENH
jgi:hypothetical protein